MRHVRANHPMVYVLDNLLQSGMECIQVIKLSPPSFWPKATVAMRLLANIEDGWLEAAAFFSAWKTETRFTDGDLKHLMAPLQDTHEDLERIHRLIHEVTPEVAMDNEKTTMAVEAMVSLFNTVLHASKHIQECMIVECGLTAEEKAHAVSAQKTKPQVGPMFFSGNLDDFLRHLRGQQDLD